MGIYLSIIEIPLFIIINIHVYSVISINYLMVHNIFTNMHINNKYINNINKHGEQYVVMVANNLLSTIQFYTKLSSGKHHTRRNDNTCIKIKLHLCFPFILQSTNIIVL